MFAKTFLLSALAVLAMSAQVNAHAAITPMLGVNGTPARSDVQRPTAAKPCGNADLSKVSSSTPVTAAADGSVSMNIQDFNAGADGSRSVKTVMLDTTGTGKSFKTAGKVTTNGQAAPTKVGSDKLVVQMPAGTKCTGAGGICLLSMTTTAGFGNCVAVKVGGAAKRDPRAAGSRAARAYLEAEAVQLD